MSAPSWKHGECLFTATGLRIDVMTADTDGGVSLLIGAEGSQNSRYVVLTSGDAVKLAAMIMRVSWEDRDP